MAFLNTSVFCNLSKHTLSPWTIVQLQGDSHTFSDFFQDVIKLKLRNITDCRLVSAHVGPEKASLDLVDTSFLVLPVLNSFGRFLKYSVEGDELASVNLGLEEPCNEPGFPTCYTCSK